MTATAEAWRHTHETPAAPAAPRRGRRGLQTPFEGAGRSRFEDDWVTRDWDPLRMTSQYLTILRQRSRYLAGHAPHFIGAINLIVNNVVGQGFRVTPMPRRGGSKTVDAELASQLVELREDWECEVDADRRESLTMLLRTAVREYVEAGEAFLVESMRESDRDRVLPLSIEVRPSEELDHGLERSQHRVDTTPAGNRIHQGIEFNRAGQRVAYWFSLRDEFGAVSTRRERITADRVYHLYHKIRARQERGIPWLYGATVLCRDLDDLMDTELTSAQVAACLTAFVTRKSAGQFGLSQERDSDDMRPVHRFAPGMIADLAPDETVEIADPNRPTGAFEPFASFILRSLARTIGISYESLSGDWRRVNYSSGRLGQLVERKMYRTIQSVIVQLAGRPIHRSFVRVAVLAGKIIGLNVAELLADYRSLTRARFIGEGWEHADPLKEVTAAAVRILTGLSTLEKEAAALGEDWRALIAQRQRELEILEEAGIPIVSISGIGPLSGSEGGRAAETSTRASALAGMLD